MIVINRLYQHDCTLGILNYLDFRCFTLELPWRFNTVNKSCIPSGYYSVRKHFSPTHGDCLLVDNVPGRTWILFHVGNFTEEIEGCILPGESIVDINGDGIPDVTYSKKTLTRLLDVLKFDTMGLLIR